MTKDRMRDVVAVKVALEERWAYARRMQKLSYERMQHLAPLPVAEGGLGYALTTRTLKRRAESYFVQMRETLQGDIAMRAQRQSDEIDVRAWAARQDLDAARAAGDAEAAEAADRRLAAAMRDERELFGLGVVDEISRR